MWPVIGFGTILASNTLRLFTPLTLHLESTTLPMAAVPMGWYITIAEAKIRRSSSSFVDFEVKAGHPGGGVSPIANSYPAGDSIAFNTVLIAYRKLAISCSVVHIFGSMIGGL